MKRNRRKRSIWIDIAFSTAIMSMTAIALLVIFNFSDDSSNASSEVEPAEPEIVVNSADSSFPGIKIVTEMSNDPKAPFAIQYPQSEYEEFNHLVKEYIEEAKEAYLSSAAGKQNNKTPVKELNISFETMQHSTGTYSFVLSKMSSTKEADRQTEIRTFHINPETGEGLTAAEIVGNNAEHLKRVVKVVRDRIFHDPKLKDLLLPDRVQEFTEPLWRNYRQFALTDNELIFYFEADQFTKATAGPPSVVVPLAKVNSYIEEAYRTAEEDQPNDKKVALTFDDGPDPDVTSQILATLEKYDAKATFFMLGSRVEYYPEMAMEVAKAGHELGNHSWNHPALPKLDDEMLIEEIQGTSEMIQQVTGQPATVFRPPYGAVDDRVRSKTNLPVVMWDVDTLDWKHHNPNEILAKVKHTTRPGSIILMHDIHQSTADGLDAILAYLQSEGYSFVTVSELDHY